MMIRIRYPDGKYDMVKITRLDDLIASKRIFGFRRATDWVLIGRDPIRKNSGESYCGPERRHLSSSSRIKNQESGVFGIHTDTGEKVGRQVG